MSTTSSSDEERRRLCEAVDPQFVVSKTEKTEIKKSTTNVTPHYTAHNGTKKTHSLRKTSNEDEDWNSLGTTPGFRAHVAQRLSQALDKQIKEIDSSKRLAHSEKEDCGGILLFASSTKLCDIADGTQTQKPKRLKKRKASTSSSDDESKFKQVAVSGDWVLDKKGVYKENPQPADIVVINSTSKVREKK